MLHTLTAPDADRLREFFEEAGYTEEQLRSGPLLPAFQSRKYGIPPFFLSYTQEPSAINLLWRLFLIGAPVPRAAALEAFPEPVLSAMFDAGMLSGSADALSGNISLMPAGQFLIAADPIVAQSEQHAGLIVWPNQSTGALQNFAIQRLSQTTLDLGSGSGVLSLFASQFSDKVVATDLNPRAEAFTRFNAWLNGVTNVECYTGDTYQPVASQSFDRILANPPFFVTPGSGPLYSENPMELDQYCRRVVREGAARLNEGGYLQIVFEWVQPHGRKWHERIAEWVEGTGCDAWILKVYQGPADLYAHQRTQDDFAAGPAAATEKYNQWVSYYQEKGVEQICGGVLALRRRSAVNWVRFDEIPLSPSQPYGDSVLDLFETQTLLSGHLTDDQMLSLKPELSTDARLTQILKMGDGRWTLIGLNLSLSSALPSTLSVETQVAEFLTRCRGEQTIAELAAGLAQRLNVSEEQTRSQCCAVVRKLAERRFLLFS